MAKENLTNTESINRRGSFLRPLVDKIRSIDAKWILGGIVVGSIIFGLAVPSQVLKIGAFGVSIIATGLFVCATDAFEIPSKH